jgi:hypothetical protein
MQLTSREPFNDGSAVLPSGWAVATLNLTALAASLKMQFNSTRHSAIKEWLKGIDYMQPKTGAIKVMYSSNGITGTVSY